MDQALNSQKTPHTSPLRASYGMSFVSILMKNDRVIKGFYCILTYGSDVWGLNKPRTLHVKGTTCNDGVTGERGKFPPSVYCHIIVLCYYHRLLIKQDNRVVKSVFKALRKLN